MVRHRDSGANLIINEAPEKITLDGSRASHRAVAELKAEGALPAQTLVRTNKYLNNMIEQDHRKVKQRCYPMLGFKTFGNAEVTLIIIGEDHLTVAINEKEESNSHLPRFLGLLLLINLTRDIKTQKQKFH